MEREALGLLRQVRDAIDNINTDNSGLTFDAFLDHRVVRQATERNFEIIGEAVNRLAHHHPDIAAQISAASAIVSFRNVIIHGYDIVDHLIVWNAIQQYVPVLKAEVDALIGALESRS